MHVCLFVHVCVCVCLCVLCVCVLGMSNIDILVHNYCEGKIFIAIIMIIDLAVS